MEKKTVLASLNKALLSALEQDNRVYLLGEDLHDPYGGAFKVTSSLSSRFPERVISTPISEAGFTGIAAGMAMRGLLPIVEIMFGDFVTLIADQLVNHIAKFSWMYNDTVDVPLVIRTPMGGRRGYGPTHSQTLEKLFIGIPGLRIIAPNSFYDPGELLLRVVFDENHPVLFVENKLLYLKNLFSESETGEFEHQLSPARDNVLSQYPTSVIRILGAPTSHVTLVAYGYMAELASEAALKLAYEDEIFVEIIVPTLISPLDQQPILDSLEVSGRLLVLEEGNSMGGWGAEVIASIVTREDVSLTACSRLGALDLPIPASGILEEQVLPQVGDIVMLARQMVKS